MKVLSAKAAAEWVRVSRLDCNVLLLGKTDTELRREIAVRQRALDARARVTSRLAQILSDNN